MVSWFYHQTLFMLCQVKDTFAVESTKLQSTSLIDKNRGVDSINICFCYKLHKCIKNEETKHISGVFKRQLLKFYLNAGASVYIYNYC